MKKSLGANTLLFPLPTIVVGTYDENGKSNMSTAGWTGIINSKPSMLSVSFRKATETHDNIIKNGAFTVGIPSKKHILETDYVGTKSGKWEDKFETTCLTPVHSDLVKAPYVSEFPVTLECKLVKYDELGLHTMFIGEILDVKIDEDCLKENGMADIEEIDPISYVHGDRVYYGLGEYLGSANRMWQVSMLNEKFNSGHEKEILQLVLDYYKKLDNAEEIEVFKEMIDWDNFEMFNRGSTLAGFEQYADWYKGINETIFNRKHVIEKLEISSVENDKYEVIMKTSFSGKLFKEGTKIIDKIRDKADLKWIVEKLDGKFKLVTYFII